MYQVILSIQPLIQRLVQRSADVIQSDTQLLSPGTSLYVEGTAFHLYV